MRGLSSILLFVLFLAAGSRAEAGCVDAASLTHSSVAITRYFDDAERAAARPGVSGAQGTAWFLSPTTLVTVAHVAEGMKLSTQVWKPIDIQDGDDMRSIAVRILYLSGAEQEKLAVLELQRPVAGARSVAIRTTPLVPEDPVVTLAYPDGRPRLVGGRFVKVGNDRLAGAAMLELYDGNDRLAVDHGASGAPVFDCEGRVAAVVSTVITQTLAWASNDIRISTAWGTPNVVSVPIGELKDLSATP
jgi:trypsin-like peptidase